MCAFALEDLTNCLALVGNNRGDINQGVYVWMICSSGCYDGPAVRMADKNDSATLPAQYSFYGIDIITQ
jgi:hypothetical protein